MDGIRKEEIETTVSNDEEWRRFTFLDSLDHHQPTPEQIAQIERLRAAAKVYAENILAVCPHSADRSAALRKLRECNMTAIASIVLKGR